MKFFAVVAPFLLTLAPVLASPLEASDLAALKGDIDNLPRKNIQCGGRNAHAQTYNPSEIEKTAEKALELVADKKQLGANRYPHGYGYRDAEVKFPESACARGTGNLYEFPIISRGLYNGAEPGADRVVIKIKGQRKATYCGLVTHLDVAGNNFKSCSG